MHETGFRTVTIWGTSITEESAFNLRCDLEDLLKTMHTPKDEDIIDEDEELGPDADWITLEINCNGGEFIPGIGIYDWMRHRVPKLQTVGYGAVSSMAVILLLAGNHRAVSKNTRLLLHPVSDIIGAQVSMNPKNHMESARSLLTAQKMYIDTIVDRVGKKADRKEIEKLINGETLLTPKRALKLGLIHEIL